MIGDGATDLETYPTAVSIFSFYRFAATKMHKFSCLPLNLGLKNWLPHKPNTNVLVVFASKSLDG